MGIDIRVDFARLTFAHVASNFPNKVAVQQAVNFKTHV